MALKFRKRIRLFPGCTINFSKTGISTTLGIKGLSVNIGKRGTYLNTGIPGTGIYDRLKISGNNSNNEDNKHNYSVQNNNVYSAIKSDNNRDITADEMKELKAQLLNAYNEKKSLHEIWNKASTNRKIIRVKQVVLKILIIGFFLPSIEKELEEAIDAEEQARKVYDDYNYEFKLKTNERIDKLFGELTERFDALSKSDRIWDITDSRYADSYKERKEDGTRIVIRKQVALKKGRLDFIKSKYDALIFENANGGNIYFYPGFAIVFNGDIEKSAFIDYPSINFAPKIVRFTESSGYIPSDAEQVDTQYKYVNKNGLPDLRYFYNPTYPVMAYSKYVFSSDKGLYEEFQFSNAETAVTFAEKYVEFLCELINQASKNAVQTLIENSDYFYDIDNYIINASKYAKQAFEYIKKSDFENANELLDKALVENNNDIISYLGKLLCEYKVNSINDLINSVELIRVDNTLKNNFDIGQSENFKRAKTISFKNKNIKMYSGLCHIQIEALYIAIMKYYTKISNDENVKVIELKAIKKAIAQVADKFDYKDLNDKALEIQGIIDEITNSKKKILNNEFEKNISNNLERKFKSKRKYIDIVFLIPIIVLIYILINKFVNHSAKNYNIPNQNKTVIKETVLSTNKTEKSPEAKETAETKKNIETEVPMQINYNEKSSTKNDNLTKKNIGLTQAGNDWYYYNENGVKVINDWIKINDNLYCFGADGKMYKNTWINYSNRLYYVDETGKMLISQWVSNKYVGDDGAMLRNTITPDGYYVDVDGNYIKTNKNNIITIEENEIKSSNAENNSNNSGNNRDLSNHTSSSSKNISLAYVKSVDVRKLLSNGETLNIDLQLPVFSGDGSDKLNNLTNSKQNDIFNSFVEITEDSIAEEHTDYGSLKIYICSIYFYKNEITYQDYDIVEIENEGQVNWSNGDTDKIIMLLTYNKKNDNLEYAID